MELQNRKASARRVRLVSAGIVFILIAVVIRITFPTFSVNTDVMLPTLKRGDSLVASRVSYLLTRPRHGDLIVFRWQESQAPDWLVCDRDSFFSVVHVFRVAGVPGDRVEIKAGEVWIDGKAIDEPYLSARTRGSFGPKVIPEDHVFVLGDNRNNSMDSRAMGPVHMKNVVGKICFVIAK